MGQKLSNIETTEVTMNIFSGTGGTDRFQDLQNSDTTIEKQDAEIINQLWRYDNNKLNPYSTFLHIAAGPWAHSQNQLPYVPLTEDLMTTMKICLLFNTMCSHAVKYEKVLLSLSL